MAKANDQDQRPLWGLLLLHAQAIMKLDFNALPQSQFASAVLLAAVPRVPAAIPGSAAFASASQPLRKWL